MLKRWLNLLGIVTTTAMFVVLLMGDTVTNTGSQHGCGRSWPLCHGKLIPQFAVSTMIEFSHRAVVGVVTVLILALAAGSLAIYWRRTEIRILAPLMVVFLFLQAGLGAWAVMEPQLSAVLALHFGVSLISFASVLLTAVFLLEQRNGSDAVRDVPVPRGFVWAVWGLTAYTYVVVYLGAYVRHTNADDACSGWPLCNGAVIPTFAGKVATMFAHRGAAGLLVLGVVALTWWAQSLRSTRPDLSRGSRLVLLLVVLQALSGAVVVLTKTDLFSAIAHAGLVGLMFGALSYLCLHTVRRSAPARLLETRRSSAYPEAARAVR